VLTISRWDVVDTGKAKSGMGVTHVAEVSSIWGGGSRQAEALDPYIQGYWTSFIRSKDPNTHRAAGSPEWGTWGTTNSRLHFPNDVKHVSMAKLDSGMERRCDYYSVIGNLVGN
jgi:hypothetical protein